MQRALRERLLTAATLAMILTLPAAATAQDDEPVPTSYCGVLAGYMIPDPARNANHGLSIGGVFSKALADSVAFEFNAFGTRLKRKTDGNDTVDGAGLDLALGTLAAGNPFFLLGGGAVQQQLQGVKKTAGFGELGLGVYLPFSFAGEMWRLEGRYQIIFNNHPMLANRDIVEDGRINLGVMFPFGWQEAENVPPPVPTPVAPVNDSDGDGVPDDKDQCPNTPKWARVDERGCIPDSDGDGVDDARDDCPNTPPGTPVDAHGCPLKPAPPPVADEDHDGVPDDKDLCPHTPARFEVDEHGCVRIEDAELNAVHFDIDSARLTADGYTLLRQVAAALMAQPELKIEVDGYADATGSARHNLELSRDRAQVVKDFLNYAGVAEDRMTVKAFGKSGFARENNNAENRSYSRRVGFRRLGTQ